MKTETVQDYKARILRVLLHIQHHLDDAVSLEELAEIAHFSPYHFHRVFCGMVGETVMEHLRRLRIERAALQLIHGNQSVATIAFQAGYETHDAFIRAFRNAFDETPSSFRKSKRSLLSQMAPSEIHYQPEGDLNDFTPINSGDSRMEVQVKQLQPLRVAFIRNIGPYQTIDSSRVWERLCQWAGPRGLLNDKTIYIGISHDDPKITPPDKIRYDACITVGAEVKTEGEIGIQEVSGGLYAVTTHQGPFESLDNYYYYLCGQWAPANGYELRSVPSFEIYHPKDKNSKIEEMLIEIHVPIEKAK